MDESDDVDVSADESAVAGGGSYNWWRKERAHRQAELDAFVAANRTDFDAFRRNPAGNTGVPMIMFRLFPELFPEVWGAPSASFADSFAGIGLFADPFEPSRVLPLGLGYSGLPAILTPMEEALVALERRSEEDLARTLEHERFHAAELRQGRPYPATHHEIDAFEDRAYAHEEQWWTDHSVRPEGAQ